MAKEIEVTQFGYIPEGLSETLSDGYSIWFNTPGENTRHPENSTDEAKDTLRKSEQDSE